MIIITITNDKYVRGDTIFETDISISMLSVWSQTSRQEIIFSELKFYNAMCWLA